MRRIRDPWRRPIRIAIIGFLSAIAVTAAILLGRVLADDGTAPAPPQTASPPIPTNASPETEGLAQIDPSEVPDEGLSFGRLRILPAGAVPQDNREFKLLPNETMRGWNPRVEPMEVERSSGISIPESTDWSVTRDGSGYITVGDRPRLVEESVVVEHRASPNPWLLATGPLIEGAYFEEILSARDGANFTYTHDGIIATVIDNSPKAATDRVWHVKLVIRDHWVSFIAPAVALEDVVPFIAALIEAN